MAEEKIENLLNQLSDAATEKVRPELADDIKRQIPHRLTTRRYGMDTINIMIDLRVGKLAAAAVIIITVILSASFLGSGDSTSENLIKESRLLIKYCLGGENATKSDVISGMSRFYEYWSDQGRDIVYYGDNPAAQDSNSILIHWKHSDDQYRVIFGDLSTDTVSAEELIKLQSYMLRKRVK